MWHWFLHITGSDDESGPWYGFWSGFAGCIPEFAIFGVIWHRLNCHERGCWRIGRHKGADHVVRCTRHHRGQSA